MLGTVIAGRTAFIPFAFSSATTGAVIKPVIPLFQAFSPIPAQRSTYCDCIKVGRKIDPPYNTGHRQCIVVTNNEVSDEESKELYRQGYKPGDEEWEKLGIARYVTWPRTVCSIEGHDVNGKPLKGEYLGDGYPDGTPIQMSDGFKANAAFFKLGFLDKTAVALGRQLAELIPILWLKAGAHGACPELKDENASMMVLPENRFAILIDEKQFQAFEQEMVKHPEIETIYFVTDSDQGYREMIRSYDDKSTYQLYRDYLDNFRINTRR